jgi:hypothetical protein
VQLAVAVDRGEVVGVPGAHDRSSGGFSGAARWR